MKLKDWVLLGVLFSVPLAANVRAEECDRSDPNLLLPDLIARQPTGVLVYDRPPRGRLVTFTTAIGNVGDGPLIMHGHTIQTPDGPRTEGTQEIRRAGGSSCTRLAGTFVFHPTHFHMHFSDFAAYELRKDDPFTGEPLRRSSKTSFCLLDVMRLPGFFGSTQFRNQCRSAEGTQGISVGYADVYPTFLDGQHIELDPNGDVLPPGDYFIVNIANPDKLIWEKNDDPQANAGVVSVTVGAPPQRKRGRVIVNQPLSPNVPIHPNLSSPPPAAPTPRPRPTARPQVIVRQPHAPHAPGRSRVDVPPPQRSRPSVVVRIPREPHRPHQPGQ